MLGQCYDIEQLVGQSVVVNFIVVCIVASAGHEPAIPFGRLLLRQLCMHSITKPILVIANQLFVSAKFNQQIMHPYSEGPIV